jgi:hypothetical protein
MNCAAGDDEPNSYYVAASRKYYSVLSGNSNKWEQ